MTPRAFAEIYPRLYHMTAAGGAEGIRRHGLLPTAKLLDAHGADAALREAAQFARRPEEVALGPSVTLRDNKVLNEKALAKALTGGLTPRDWYGLLNERVFLWANPKRLDKLLAGRAYRGRPHDILTFDTLPLVTAYADRVEGTPMNTGAAFMRAVPRGRDTFVPLADIPFDEWKAKRGQRDAVVEVVIPGGVPDAADYLLAVTRRQDGEPDETLWTR